MTSLDTIWSIITREQWMNFGPGDAQPHDIAGLIKLNVNDQEFASFYDDNYISKLLKDIDAWYDTPNNLNDLGFFEFIKVVKSDFNKTSIELYCVTEFRQFLADSVKYSNPENWQSIPRYDGKNSAINFYKNKYPQAMRRAIHADMLARHDERLFSLMQAEAFRTDIPFNDIVMPREVFAQRLSQAIEAVFEIHLKDLLSLDVGILENVLSTAAPVFGKHTEAILQQRLSPSVDVHPLSENSAKEEKIAKPPQWSDQEARKGHTAISFLLTYYGKRIGMEQLTSPMLREEDFELYMAFQKFKSRYPDKVDFHLPTKQEIVAQEVEARAGSDLGEMSAREYQRLQKAAYRIRKRE